MKTLETYFRQDVVLPETRGAGADLTDSERAFLEKYVGSGWENTPEGRALSTPVQGERVLDAAAAPAGGEEAGEPNMSEDLETALMSQEEVRLVSFRVAEQLFAVPIMLVQEVLRAVPATKLPAAPPYLAGVTNLRGRVTPLVNLARLLDIDAGEGGEDRFLIVCRLRDMQIGLMVRAIDTMYKPAQNDIEWNIEARVGVSADLMSGLLKTGDYLIKILSVSRLFTKVLKS